MGTDKPPAKTEDLRRARLAASLKENLKRRKAQSRARAAEATLSERSEARTSRDSRQLTSRTPGRRRSCDRLDLG
jgi:hypothetical protein